MMMTFVVNFTRRASADIAIAEEVVAKIGTATLQRWRSRLGRVVEHLERDPHRFPEADEAATIGMNIRMALVGRKPQFHRVLFTIEETTVTIHRVRHAAQDRLIEDDI
jgi:plasmid stabilization system protein ParE